MGSFLFSSTIQEQVCALGSCKFLQLRLRFFVFLHNDHKASWKKTVALTHKSWHYTLTGNSGFDTLMCLEVTADNSALLHREVKSNQPGGGQSGRGSLDKQIPPRLNCAIKFC